MIRKGGKIVELPGVRGLALVLTVATLPIPAEAFIYLGGSNFEKGERPISAVPSWPTRILRFHVNTNLSALGGSNSLPITGSELLLAAEAAAGAWGQACRADLHVQLAGTTTATYNTSDGTNTILWDRRSFGEGNYYGNDTSILAAATTVVSGDDFADCDIVLNGNAATQMEFSPLAGQADLRSVLTHEIGHCLGLDHPIEPNAGTPSLGYDSAESFLRQASMVQTVTLADPSDTTRRDINQDDRDGIECIYERGRPLRTGSRCGSYTGTNNQGSLIGNTTITGGPSGVDTNCGTDTQGRNARPSSTTGDGCIGSAVAATGSTQPNLSILDRVGGSFGFWLFIAFAVFLRLLRIRTRRALRSSIPIPFLVFALSVGSIEVARAWELEVHYEHRNVKPRLWNSFAAMDAETTAWDRDPSAVKFGSFSEISASAFSEFETWGKWGGFLALSLPKTQTTHAKATNAAEQTKKTTLGGFRFGPEVRWFPVGHGGIRWFVGSRVGIGLFAGSQNFESSAGAGSSGGVSFQAWSLELAASTGVEIPVGPVAIVLDAGYSRLRSSYLSASGTDGSVYSDFPSGTRLAVDTGPTTEDLRFVGSGVYGRVGILIALGGGKKSTEREQPAYDDYESSPTPPAESKSSEPIPVPAPTATPLADPMQTEREFQDSIRVAPPPPMVPQTREAWEIDPIPSEVPTSRDGAVLLEPNRPDPVP